MSESVRSTFTVNGNRAEVEVEPRMSLADCLRHKVKLTGTHVGCEHGVCGACTVLVDGNAVRSCLMLAVQADGAEITTVEGLPGAQGDTLGPLQASFRKHHALQCGFCTPGILITAHALLSEEPTPASSAFAKFFPGISAAALATSPSLRRCSRRVPATAVRHERRN